jgi:ABC-type glutathione transport system ATPase component
MEPILETRQLSVRYPGPPGHSAPRWVLRDINLRVAKGDILGIAGESGSGKTTLALGLLNLTGFYGATASGQVLFENRDLLALPEAVLRRIRGNQIALVLQNTACLDPLFTIGNQLREVIAAHQQLPPPALRQRAQEVLLQVQLPADEGFMKLYPHQLSGGMLQRVMIAMAIANHPKVLIADEPTSSIDVTTQAEILQLLRRLHRDLHTTILLISHDLAVLSSLCNSLVVMKDGVVVEEGLLADVFRQPADAYTKGLLKAIPRVPEFRDPKA